MTVARETQDEAAEVMRCLGESLRDPAFASVLAVLVAGKRQAGLDDSADSDVAGAAR